MTAARENPPATLNASPHRLFSLRRVGAIAGNTFRDLVRQKVFYFMLVFAVLVIGASLALVSLSFQGQLQTVMGVSFGAMTLFTTMLAVLSVAMLIPKDMEDRTLYTILAKPVARFEYLMGKLAGVSAVLLVATALMAAVFCAVLFYWQGREIAGMELDLPADRAAAEIARLKSGTFTPTLFGGIGVMLIRAIVCATLTLMLSCFATSWLFTVITSLTMILVGHLLPIARGAVQGELQGAGELPFHVSGLLRFIAISCPDMQLFNIVDDIAVGVNIPGEIFLKVAGLGAGYVAVYFLVGYLFFAWREL